MFPMTMPFSETPGNAGIFFVLVWVNAGLLLSVALKVNVWGISSIPSPTTTLKYKRPLVLSPNFKIVVFKLI